MDNTGLAQGAWTPDVYAALNELVQTHGINSRITTLNDPTRGDRL